MTTNHAEPCGGFLRAYMAIAGRPLEASYIGASFCSCSHWCGSLPDPDAAERAAGDYAYNRGMGRQTPE